MHPILLDFAGAQVPAYLTMIMFGFFAAIFIARRDAEALGIDGVRIVDLGILMLLLGVLGARLLAVLTDGSLQDFIHLCTDSRLVDPVDTSVKFCQTNKECGFDYLCNLSARDAVLAGSQRSMCYPPGDCLAAIKFWQGGLTYYGGVLLALPGAWIFMARKSMPKLVVADVMAAPAMLGLAFGRMGCFLNGCCYGGKTNSVFGVRFPGHFQDRHPTQLYELVFALSLYVFLRHLLPKLLRGQFAAGRALVFGLMLSLYGIFRVLIEFLRDDPRGALGPLSTSQLISIPVIALGLWLVARAIREEKLAAKQSL